MGLEQSKHTRCGDSGARGTGTRTPAYPSGTRLRSASGRVAEAPVVVPQRRRSAPDPCPVEAVHSRPAALRAAQRRRHSHFLTVVAALEDERSALRSGDVVRIVRGRHAGQRGTVRPEEYDPDRQLWSVDVEEGRSTSVEHWWLPRDQVRKDCPGASEAAVLEAEHILAKGLRQQFLPPLRPAHFPEALPHRFCPYPDGSAQTRRCHRNGATYSGYFQVNPRLDPAEVHPNGFFRPGTTLPITLRHSNMNSADDAAMDVRGAALRFAAPGDESPLDLMMATGTYSPWWSADSLVEFAEAHSRGASALQLWLQRNPWSLAAYIDSLHRSPKSFRSLSYHTHDLYELVGVDGAIVRCRFALTAAGSMPPNGDAAVGAHLPPKDARAPWHRGRLRDSDLDRDYLRSGLREELKADSVVYWLLVQVFPGDMFGASHGNPTLPPPSAATTQGWTRLGDVTITGTVPDEVGEELVYSVAHHPACLRPPAVPTSHDFGSALILRHRVFPPTACPVPRAPPDFGGHHGGLWRYRLRFFVGESKPRREYNDKAAVHVTIVGYTSAGEAVETPALRLPHWSKNAFRQLSADEWMAPSPVRVPDVRAVRVHFAPAGRHAVWYLKRVDITVEKEGGSGAPSVGDAAVTRSRAAIDAAFATLGLPPDPRVLDRPKMRCAVVGVPDRPEGAPCIDLLHVRFVGEAEELPCPAAALAPVEAPVSITAHQWLPKGRTLLLAAKTAAQDDDLSSSLRREALKARQQQVQWAEAGSRLPLVPKLTAAADRTPCAVRSPGGSDSAEALSRFCSTVGCSEQHPLSHAVMMQARRLEVHNLATSQDDRRLHVAGTAELGLDGVFHKIAETRQGLPVWERDDTAAWIWSRRGAWVVGADLSEAATPERIVTCSQPHGGAPPTAQRGGAWTSRAGTASVSVEAYPVWGGTDAQPQNLLSAARQTLHRRCDSTPAVARDGGSSDRLFGMLFSDTSLCLQLREFNAWHDDLTRLGQGGRLRITDEDIEPLVPEEITDSLADGLERGGGLLSALSQRRLLLVADYDVLKDLPTRPGRVLAAPVILLLRRGGAVVPLAVQLTAAGKPVTPTSGASWAAAKSIALSSAAHVLFNWQYLVLCRRVPGAVAAACHRCLSSGHPVHDLLLPHLAGAPLAAAQAAAACDEGAITHSVFALTAAGAITLQERLWGEWSRRLLRPIDAPDGLPFREQGDALLKSVSSYVRRRIRGVAGSVGPEMAEVAAWMDEIATALRCERSSLPSVEGMCSSFLWTVTVLQTAVSRTLWHVLGSPLLAPAAVCTTDPASPVRPGLPAAALQVAFAATLARSPPVMSAEEVASTLDVLNRPSETAGKALPLGWWNEDTARTTHAARAERKLQGDLGVPEMAADWPAQGAPFISAHTVPNHLHPLPMQREYWAEEGPDEASSPHRPT